MANIQDYIEWRGDLSFEQTPFCNVDALILCQISYLNFDRLLPDYDFNYSQKLSELAVVFESAKDFKKRSEAGLLINKKTAPFFLSLAKCRRFENVLATGYVSKIDLSIEEQFAAVSYKLPDGTNFICFRGTDDSIVGWKEDFNLATEEEVPAQKDAVEYLEKAAKSLKGKLRLGGHSKGGNLSMYASAVVDKKISDRILCIYNNDGPGFYEARVQSPEFLRIADKVESFYPRFSIVGMLFQHIGKQTFVESDEIGIMQHDPFSWHIMGNNFVVLENNDYGSKFFHNTFNEWISNLAPEKRGIFVDTVFKIIESTDAKTNTELEENFARNSVKVLKTINKLDPEMRKVCRETVIEFFKAGHSQLTKADTVIKQKLEESTKHTKNVLKKITGKIFRKKQEE